MNTHPLFSYLQFQTIELMVTFNKRVLLILSVLTLIFMGRVFAQLIQFLNPIEFLLPFDQWQSGTMAYYWLFLSQILILGLQITILLKIHFKTYVFRIYRGKTIYFFGIVYFSMSVLRLLLGSLFLEEHHFWGATIPSIFHVFLSSFFLILGLYEVRNSNKLNSPTV